MTLVQWRCFVGYLSHWYPTISVKDALKDLGIDMDEDDALWEVRKCGYSFSYETGLKWEKTILEDEL